MAETARIGEKHANLAVLNASRCAGILPCHSNRMLAFLQKSGLINDEYTVRIAQRFDD
jgi:hypothetical protein